MSMLRRGPDGNEPDEICTDAFQANRGPDATYVTAPLAGMITKSKRGFYHDGRFRRLIDVVHHYDSCFSLRLSGREMNDLVQFLRSR